ncbi:MAG TPA: EI24 domain-containing protein [Bdellovibrionales bacterium]|nr:EI24 domain-containing protein [Bdellovibrionales bacterium]
MIKDFFRGLTFWLRGWRCILSQKRLLAVAAMPLILSFFAAVACLYVAVIYYPIWVQAFFVGWLGDLTSLWAQLLYYPSLILSGLLLFVAIIYLVYAAHAIIAVPFYTHLSEKTLALRGLKPGAGSALGMLRVSLIKGAVFICFGVALFVCSFVPGLNALAIVGTLLLLAFDCNDYALEAMRLNFRERLRYARRTKAQWLGQAAGLGLTLVIPGLTLLVIPGAVVGAALILKEPHEPRIASPENSRQLR